jgi:ABC-type sulfate transport system permease component
LPSWVRAVTRVGAILIHAVALAMETAVMHCAVSH